MLLHSCLLLLIENCTIQHIGKILLLTSKRHIYQDLIARNPNPHNFLFIWSFCRCEATNEADNLSVERNLLDFDPKKSRPAAEVRILVQYAPSVTVQPVRPGMVEEGTKVNFLKSVGSGGELPNSVSD